MEPLQEMEELKNTWSFQQSELRNKIIEIDSDVKLKNDEWKYVGGLDISFIIGDDVNACACYVIINRDLEVRLTLPAHVFGHNLINLCPKVKCHTSLES